MMNKKLWRILDNKTTPQLEGLISDLLQYEKTKVIQHELRGLVQQVKMSYTCVTDHSVIEAIEPLLFRMYGIRKMEEDYWNLPYTPGGYS